MKFIKDILNKKAKEQGKKRSSRWPTVRKKHLEENPTCAACGGNKYVEVHHIKPFHLHPELELDPTNLISLCEANNTFNCHLIVGHKMNFREINENSVKDSQFFRKNYFDKK